MTYSDPLLYYKDAVDKQERITRLTTIITNLETCAAQAALGADIQNYSFNDGQTQINTNYRSIDDLMKSIDSCEKLLARLINSMQGRSTILRDADVLPRRFL